MKTNKELQILLKSTDVEQFISQLYKTLLGREPDNNGLKNKSSALLSGDITLGDLIQVFVNSQEGRNKHFNDIWDKRKTIYEMVTHESDLSIVDKLFSKTAQYWRNAGVDKKEVYFSVLSSPDMKKKLTEQDVLSFYSTGDKFIDFCINCLEKRGVTSIDQLNCLDFGCGVGRLAFSASKYFKQVWAVDFSKGHLQLLEKNMTKLPSLHGDNITPVYLDNIHDVERCIPDSIDFIYSHISLQHNTPSVMAFIIDKLLMALNVGGYACLHIPIHHPFYDFSEAEYMQANESGTEMEMHMLPRQSIQKIAEKTGATIIDSFGYGGTKGVYSEVFFFAK